MRIGFYGGSFDPFHLGHLNVAVEMLETHRLESVWLCPAHISPDRMESPPAPPHHRLAMVRLAIREIPSLRVITEELDRPPPSYTLETLQQLHMESVQPLSLFLILGIDSALSFFRWHQPEEIIKLSIPLVAERPTTKLVIAGETPVAVALRAGLTPIRQMDVSSSEIRDRLRRGAHIDHLVPAAVYRYIRRHNLYR